MTTATATIRYCTRCVLPDTRPGLTIGDDGVCSACRAHGRRREIDWPARRRRLEQLFAEVRGRSEGFDCVIPVSGGKDSTWQVATCLEHGLRILAVTWRTPGRTPLGQQNLDNLVSLGVDHIDWTINPDVERRFTLATLERTGSTAVPMHMAVYSIPLRVALRFDIPLVIWGENPRQEYMGRDESDEATLDPEYGKRHGIFQGSMPQDWIGPDLSRKDLEPYFPPSRERFAASGLRSIFLGDFLPWDPETSLREATRRGFRARAEGPRLGYYDYADIDCDFISVHHWFKWLKFGFTRLWDNLALEIRNGRLSRGEAIEIIARRGDQRPDDDIRRLCEFLRISEDRFCQIEQRFRNPHIWTRRDDRWVIDGFLIERWEWR